ncbi:hypothetical protein [Phormidium sp. FACHB-1136]|uniref:hypothetical protein n=1 Tax=Phormidium sp. FACHB-1136 TaxID=2692848 RepID=UPI001682C870|nr:hypothetical protein [Phormidium sp. FACHB-1136]MBD2428420.1 hypothetical protein [Phormidium sp. FACHB-1136]
MTEIFDFEIDATDCPASCLDCAHWCPAAGCALAGNPAVDAFTDPYNGPNDADMSHCPGFEDV